MFKDPDDVEAKTGRDDKLETEADKWLSKSVGKNKRSVERDVEKMLHESGQAGELEHYDPDNDWDTQDAPNGAILINPADVVKVTPSICADMDDGNVRARNLNLSRRNALMRHMGDEDNWGSNREDIPLLGVYDGERKTCTKCGRTKRVEFFSPDKRNVGKVRSWCKLCEKAAAKMRYTRKNP
ncbi:hypothetical protein [Mycolicibacterium septicum]|uniref:hypothetical protein n=1 Tax=Mycolicibacterium septicum TaxID=98668 RepID=UPI001AFB1D11|nr:hypothetical protein [Mycolicibacterium septicum]QRY51777.1 hypothetical protein JVX95_31125 [Mycolicibacterium septicum]